MPTSRAALRSAFSGPDSASRRLRHTTVQGSMQVSAGEHWQARATDAVCAVQLASLAARSLWWHGGALAPHEAAAQRCQGVWAEVCKRATQDELREHQLIMAHVELSSDATLGRHQALWRHREGASAESDRLAQLHLPVNSGRALPHSSASVLVGARLLCAPQPQLRAAAPASM